jgi:MerR family Zn(II)-responsive transcriptional regulator of zntA
MRVGDRHLRIAELARRTGFSTATLRYYEDEGLLQPVRRTDAGYRVYDDEAVQRVGFIQRAKALGLTLREIQQLTSEPADASVERTRLRHALVHKLADTEHRIAELVMLRAELRDQLARLGSAQTCGHVGDCGCWLPSRKEVIEMADKTASASDDGCTCCGCTCPGDGPCTCCGCLDPNC